MSTAKIVISLEREALEHVDRLVKRGLFPSRSTLIQEAVAEKLQRLRRIRLAQECAKLEPRAEQPVAEEFFRGEIGRPEY